MCIRDRLHAGFDHERKVELCEHLDAGNGHTDIAGATLFLAESRGRDSGRHEFLHLVERPVTRLVETQRWVCKQAERGEFFARLLPHVPPLPVQYLSLIHISEPTRPY